MDKIHELRTELQHTLDRFNDAQENKKRFLLGARATLMQIVQQELFDRLQQGMQQYFESRNEQLGSTLASLDHQLTEAAQAHFCLTNFRDGLAVACNDGLQPVYILQKDETGETQPMMVKGRGEADLRRVEEAVQAGVGQLNQYQDDYCSLLARIEENLPLKVEAVLTKAVDRLEHLSQDTRHHAANVFHAASEELDKAVKVQDNMEQIKLQLETLFTVFQEKKSPNFPSLPQ